MSDVRAHIAAGHLLRAAPSDCLGSGTLTFMPRVDYDSFRAMSRPDRVSLFESITAEERADLVRRHISRWLTLHRHELTDEQITILGENVAFIRADMYTFPRDEALVNRYVDLAKRTAMLLSRDQAREALTMYWDRSRAR
jgi:DNA replicative helicase MCM subunit Mcm2 (Cdc46/Mcm family)